MDKNLFYFIALILLGILFLIYYNSYIKNKFIDKSNVKVEPIQNMKGFYEWYDKTIGDYLADGSIEYLNQYYEVYLKTLS